jgi:shikimate dehydrogenase
VERLREPEFAGANVTIPHKIAVLPLLDWVDREARSAGAVNTIVKRGDELSGHNTDVPAIRAALDRIGAGGASRVVVLGAGGSARAVRAALPDAEPVFVARRPEAVPDLRPLAWASGEWRRLLPQTDLLVNATPLGRAGEVVLSEREVGQVGAVLDLVYVKGGTPLVRAARAAGTPALDGWEVLLAQGARAFELWTGRPAPLDAMRAAVRP